MKVIRWLDRNLEECCMAVLLVLIADVYKRQMQKSLSAVRNGIQTIWIFSAEIVW